MARANARTGANGIMFRAERRPSGIPRTRPNAVPAKAMKNVSRAALVITVKSSLGINGGTIRDSKFCVSGHPSNISTIPPKERSTLFIDQARSTKMAKTVNQS